jgi:hypothetical protein
MKSVSHVRIVALLATALVFPAAWFASERLNTNIPAGGNQNSAAPPPQTEKPFDQAQALADLRKSIAGKENEPAEKVFKNIQLLKGVPAGRLLRVMELGYSRSLGVGGFIIPTSLVEKLTLGSQPVVVGRARTVSNEVEIKEARFKDSIKLGRFEFPQPTITFPALADESNIGLKILREFSLTFDQKNKRLKLSRQESRESTAVPTTAPAAPPSEFREYVGSYGQREISFAGDSLYLQREGGPKIKLVPASKDEFTLELVPEARIKFVRDANGRITELHVLNRAGAWETSKKVQP